jgi:hypothetical protein
MQHLRLRLRERTMSSQRPLLLQRQASEPVLLGVGGMTWDLSNLCSTQNESHSLPPNRRLDRPQSYRDLRQYRREQSIYLSKEALGRHLPADIDTSEILDRLRTPRGPRSLPISGAKDFAQLNVPSNIYDRCSQPLSRVAAARDADEFSDCYYKPQERDYYRREHGCSRYEVPQDPQPNLLNISDCISDVSLQSSRRSVEREQKPAIQVEIYPGEFLPLRGAKETIEAIEGGQSKYVFCYACGLGLRCVADCELVLCPDCRVVSPARRRRPASLLKETVCEDDDGSAHEHRRSLHQFTPSWSDKDESFHSSKQKGNMRSSGVGLGLIVIEN